VRFARRLHQEAVSVAAAQQRERRRRRAEHLDAAVARRGPNPATLLPPPEFPGHPRDLAPFNYARMSLAF